MPPVTVLVLAPELAAGAGPLERRLHEAWVALAERHRAGFLAAGADEAIVVREPPDDTPFGTRLRRLASAAGIGGLVVTGAGSIPLATPGDRRAFVEAAASDRPGALANQRYSADAIAVSRAADALRDLPDDLRSDNALPRWLAEVARVPVRDLGARRRLAMDVDSPLDLLLLDGVTPGTRHLPLPEEADARAVRDRLTRLRSLAGDPGAELLVAGRTAAVDLRWAERHTRSRTRAFVEERGLKTASIGATVGRPNRRPARSILGDLLDRDGPSSLGARIAALCDGALLDSRVLLAHRLGADERGWPRAEDRFASDLLLPDRIGDPWLAELTAAALEAPVPVLLGGHALVGPGLRLALRRPGPANP
jgi:hypothetical protein